MHLRTDGLSGRRELTAMAKAGAGLVGEGIWRITNEILSANTYVSRIGATTECLLIDPGSDRSRIEDVLVREALVPRHVLLTHGHFDHCGSAAHFQEKFGCDVRIHASDLKIMKASNFLTMAFKIPFQLTVPVADCWQELSLDLGSDVVEVIPSPGHTPGSCIFRYGHAAFTGDTLYSSGIGLSRLPGENAERLRTTLVQLMETLPPDTMVYPGHGDPAPLAQIRQHNLPLLEFVGASGHPAGGPDP